MRGVVVVAAAVLAVPPVVAAGPDATVPLVWHVETSDGEALASREADVPINPASVIKVATSLWALERLGSDHRFETRFLVRGTLDAETGLLDGDLLVQGGADPDFHVENAYRVARALNDAGLERVRGRLSVDDRFWIGWEGGSAGRREATMAGRLRDALDPARWSRRTRRLIDEFRRRTALEGPPPAVVVEGEAGARSGPLSGRVLVVHRSNPLPLLLKRFNAYSNNDIERLGRSLGTPDDLARALRERWGASASEVSLDSLSGLGRNRMTARLVVRLLRDLDATCRRRGLGLEDLLPGNGCDPGTLEHFPRLAGGAPGSVVAKTGTLVHTDGGVAVLAGVARTAQGDRFFCVAAPGAGKELARARAAEEQWLLDLIRVQGGAKAGGCGAEVRHSDDDAEVRPARARDGQRVKVAAPDEDPAPGTPHATARWRGSDGACFSSGVG